jgi:N-acetylglutamate synthase-like GNAT family acetyltransferase/uncharacterized damage-inducible protein DinB
MHAHIDPAKPGDLPAVTRLLDDSGLPTSDVTPEKLRHFLVARRGGALVGVIGVEPLGDDGLLRSAAVAPGLRGQGLGVELVAALERRAREQGIGRLFLLTTTAEKFFRGRGYGSVARDAAPPAVRDTAEYRELCASTSVLMVKDLKRRAGGMSPVIERPGPQEYAPYYQRYIDQVPEGDLLDLLRRQVDETATHLAGVKERDAGFRYAEGKWSVRDVVGHVSDTERIFVYRALCFARGERGGLPGFEENDYVANAKFGGRPLADLVAELRAVRAATVAFFAGLDGEELQRTGTANQNPYTVRAIAYIVAGHERHHTRILVERYLPALKRS